MTRIKNQPNGSKRYIKQIYKAIVIHILAIYKYFCYTYNQILKVALSFQLLLDTSKD